MADVFDDSVYEDGAAPGGPLQAWVDGVLSGLGVVPWLLLALGCGLVPALVSVARELARSHPQVGGPLAPLAMAGGAVYATMAVGLTAGGVALQGRREWARRLLVGLASVFRIAWLAMLAWCLAIIVRFGLQYGRQGWPEVAKDTTEGLVFAAAAALALSLYMASIRRALRSSAIIATCAGAPAWAEVIRAREEWAATLLAPQSVPPPEGRYPDPPSPLSVGVVRARLLSGIFLPALLVLGFMTWVRGEGGIDSGLAIWLAWAVWEGGGMLYRALRSVVSVAWDEEGAVLRRSFGMPVRVPWSAVQQVELKLPPEPRLDGSTPPFTVRLFLRRGRPFEIVMDLDTDAGRDLLEALHHRTTVTEAAGEEGRGWAR